MDDLTRAQQFKAEFFWNALKVLDFNGITGDYLEFGCHGARTFRQAASEIARRKRIPRRMWAFDSFQGLPDDAEERDAHPNWKQGRMATTRPEFERHLAEAGIAPEQVSIVEGFFSESLTRTDIEFPDDVALAYVDCDLYSSTRDVLGWLAPRLKHGAILAFDDYFCWSPTAISGERAAFAEFREAHPQWSFHRYRDYGWAGCSYVVEARS